MSFPPRFRGTDKQLIVNLWKCVVGMTSHPDSTVVSFLTCISHSVMVYDVQSTACVGRGF